jgi:TnpA family transposase
LEHKLQNENFYTPNTNIKNKDKEFLNLNEQTPDQDTKTDDIQTLPDFEETSHSLKHCLNYSPICQGFWLHRQLQRQD